MVEFDLSGHVILLVDDVPFARETMRRVLRSMNEPRIIDASNGAQAQDQLQRVSAISFVIADFNMPVVNGLQLLQAIRAGRTKASRSLPVAMLTGHSDQHLVASALALDVNAFAVKPVSATGLGKRLKQMLAQTGDTSWLKPLEEYETVRFPGSINTGPSRTVAESVAEAPPSEVATEQSEPAPESKRVKLTRPAASAGKFQEVERIAGEFAGRLIKADTSDTAESAATEITEGVKNIIVDTGADFAKSVLGTLEDMMAAGHLTGGDVAKTLAKDDAPDPDAFPVGPEFSAQGTVVRKIADVPVGAILSGDLMIKAGKRMVKDGTPLSKQLLAAIRQLQKLEVLSPHMHGGSPLALTELAIRFDNAIAADGSPMVLVRPDSIQTGSVLANDIFLKDGRPYMLSGSEFTERSATLLQDLQGLQRVGMGVWVKT